MIWDEPAHEVATHSELMRESTAAGAFRRYDDIGDMAASLGVPAGPLGDTIGCFSATSPLVGRSRGRLDGPWYAAWITHGILTTQGGLLVDPAGRVLRPDGTAIGGLSAAGGAATGISGPSPAGYSSGNGLLAAMGLGWIIGNRLASGPAAA
jgi:fumarate reductase flavoprotein subunit